MKLSYSPLLLAAVLLASSCNQTPTEQPANAPTETTPEQQGAATAPAPGTATTETPAAAAPAAPAAQPVQLSFRFKPVKDADPMMPKTNVFLVLKGGQDKEIDLGRVTGKPDVVDEAKAQRAGFPGGMIIGFRSYDPNSGTGDDLAVLQGVGGRLQILQRRVDETADQPGTFQTAREIPMPANTQLQAAPTAKK
ncbi:hypothetical protein [Hymenobacter koreensis]